MKILNAYPLPKIYKRNGAKCFLDPVRKKMIQVTPEEIVRQQVVQFLQEELQVPIEMIELEVPMSYFQQNARGRADIIVYSQNEDQLIPILIVECKAPNVELTDEVYEQVFKYDEIIYANTVMITNGHELYFLSWHAQEKRHCLLAQSPNYNDLLGQQNLVFDTNSKPTWERPPYPFIESPEVYDEFLENGWIGVDTVELLRPFIINLTSCLQDERYKLSPQTLRGVKIIEDGGIRYTTFGNAAGGSFTNRYRYFIIEDSRKNNQIISISVQGLAKSQNDPVFGNRRASTTLGVAIDDYEKSHFSLELNIDKYCIVENNKVTVWHDGTLTLGKMGAVKRSEVIEYVKTYAPELLDDQERIILGVLNNDRDITWNDPQTELFFGRLIRYALIRDDFRNMKKKQLERIGKK